MAEMSATFTAPSTTATTELWYKAKAGTLTQVFGVQSIPPIETAAEDVTYRTLESRTEFADKGVRAFESIEIECIGYPEQYKAIKTLSETDEDVEWYVKLPDKFKNEEKAITLTWKGSVDISLAEVALDDMIKTTIKIGKSSVPKLIDGLPAL